MIDLKDLFQVIFNMRKKEVENSQKVTASHSSEFTLIPPPLQKKKKVESWNIFSFLKYKSIWQKRS